MNGHWFDRLERRFGYWCVPQLAAFLVGMNALVWVLTLFRPTFPAILSLDPYLVMHGEIWRLVTFLFIPPALSPLWMFFWLYLLFVYMTALEAEWGDFKFNLFYGIGAVSAVLASFYLGLGVSNVALNSTVFLAFAALFPDFEMLLFFFLPVRVKWLAWLAWAGIAWELLVGGSIARISLAAGLVNYLVFFGSDHWWTFRQWMRRRKFH